MSNKIDADERLRKDSGADVRGPRDAADADRILNDGLSLNSAERRKQIAQGWVNEVLPTPPNIPGFHTVWLSTTNSTDPIYRRLRMGYTPVKVSEVQGMDLYKSVGGEFDGCVACNEMLLFKVPEEVYQDIMAVFHHEKPREAEESIKEQIMRNQQVDANGKELLKVEDGVNSLGRAARAPHFA